ncbi:hypothetical protein NQZ79_g715 [Umbelopsis isabellina]|nr:hypothetical protein NQZ79_g715 [Umbelopsis isabellina]
MPANSPYNGKEYVSIQAASAIIAEVGPLRISSDALVALNQFLDEFLIMLLVHAQCLDLAQFKSAVAHTLSYSSLGKNAIVEAELELKSYLAIAEVDAELDVYERMRTQKFGPILLLNDVVQHIRNRTDEFGALVAPQSKMLPTPPKPGAIVSSIVAMYLTAIVEHIAEYVLLGIARTCEAEDMSHVRIKEVYSTLLEDTQVGSAFSSMDLKTRLEKRLNANGQNGFVPGSPMTSTKYSVPMSPTSVISDMSSAEGNFPYQNCQSVGRDSEGEFEVNGDQLSIRSEPFMPRSEQPQRPSSRASQNSKSLPSMGKSNTYRPTSVLNQSSANGGAGTPPSPKAKTGFRLFGKKKKAPKDMENADIFVRAASPSTENDSDDTKAMDFEELMMSGGTMKVTLTPNRLKSIEVNEKAVQQEKLQNTWHTLKRTALQNLAQNNRSSIDSNTSNSSASYRSPPPVPVRKQKRWPDAPAVPPLPASMRNNAIKSQKSAPHQPSSPVPSAAPGSPTLSTRSMRTINSVTSLQSESDGEEPNRRDSLMSQGSTFSSIIKSAPAPPPNGAMPKPISEPYRVDSQKSYPSDGKMETESSNSPSFTVSDNKTAVNRRTSMIIAPRPPRLARNQPRQHSSLVISTTGAEENVAIPSEQINPTEVSNSSQEAVPSTIAIEAPVLFQTVTSPEPVVPSPTAVPSPAPNPTQIAAQSAIAASSDVKDGEDDDEEEEEDDGKEQTVSAFKATAHRTILGSVSGDSLSNKTSNRPSAKNWKRVTIVNPASFPTLKDDRVKVSKEDLLSLHSRMASSESVKAVMSLFEAFLDEHNVAHDKPDAESTTPAEQVSSKEIATAVVTGEEAKPLANDSSVQTEPWTPTCEHFEKPPPPPKFETISEDKLESLLISDPADYIPVRVAPIITVTDCDETDAEERPLDLTEFDVDSSDDYSDVDDAIPMSRFSYPPEYRKAQYMDTKQVYESEDEEWYLDDSDNEFEQEDAPVPVRPEILEEKMAAEWLIG